MNNETFSFRWGVDLFDNEHTQIPNWILAYYHKVPWSDGLASGEGITNTEMMFIIQLASFKYESKGGKASPSLTLTLRTRMGYKSNQGIINVQESLVRKGLLIVHKQTGKRSLYDFTPFSKKVLKLAVTNFDEDTSNPSTKLDESPAKDVSLREPGSSTKLDGTRQQNLTQRKEEEKTSKEGKGNPPQNSSSSQPASQSEEMPQINLGLPPYLHHQLLNKWIYLKQDDENEPLVKACVVKITPRRLRISIVGIDGIKTVDPTGRVFYQNGHPDLQPVIIGDSEAGEKLSSEELAMKNRLINLTGAGDLLTKAERVSAMKKCQEAGIFMTKRGNTVEQLDQFELWFPTHWRGKDGSRITLKDVSQLWNEFEIQDKGDSNGAGLSGATNGTVENGGGTQSGGGALPPKLAKIRANGGILPKSERKPPGKPDYMPAL